MSHRTNLKSRLAVCLSLLSRNRKTPFLKRVVTCDEKRILYNIVIDLYNGYMPTWPHYISRNQTLMRRRWWSLFCGVQVVLSTQRFWKVLKLLMQKYTAPNLIQYIKNYELRFLDWSTEVKFYYFMTFRDHTFPEQLSKTAQLLDSYRPLYFSELPPKDYCPFKHVDQFVLKKMFSNETAVKNGF